MRFHRKKKAWDSAVTSLMQVVLVASEYLKNWRHVQFLSKVSHSSSTLAAALCSRPLQCFLKINVDIATNVYDSHTGIDMLAPDHSGNFMAAHSFVVLGSFSPNIFEVVGVCEVFSWIKSQNGSVLLWNQMCLLWFLLFTSFSSLPSSFGLICKSLNKRFLLDESKLEMIIRVQNPWNL